MRAGARSEILEKFIQAAEHNAHDSLISVRIAASWALANICDSIRHCIDAQPFQTDSIASREGARFISLLADCALQLASDNDKDESSSSSQMRGIAIQDYEGSLVNHPMRGPSKEN
ncbi:unnamed protein product [Fraxinus pennsylvanica]|uniref:Uncharacterized protein n=1 Tax=Fraxinus pennsylvanica TaxID=56036 RepID=A0AAD2A148_9LAMI|nr:unnamed protein product [Fraxinus pennsylvanica]